MSRGLFSRKNGDKFIDDQGKTWYFDKVATYDISVIPLNVIFENTCNPAKHHYYAVATFVDSENISISYGKYFQNIANTNGLWKNSVGNLHLNTKSGKKALNANLYTPSVLVKDSAYKLPIEVLNLMQENIEDQNIVDGLEEFKNTKTLPIIFRNSKEKYEVIRDTLCECLQPIAVSWELVDGDVLAVEKQVLYNSSLKNSLICFPMTTNNALVDSYVMTNMGMSIGISSKGGDGATASIKNFHDIIHTSSQQYANYNLIKENAPFITTIETIAHHSQYEGPLILAVDLNIIDPTDKAALLSKISKNLEFGEELNEFPVLKTIYEGFLSKKNIKVEGSKDSLAILSEIAKMVAKHINTHTQFSLSAKEFIKSTKMAQIHTNASLKKEDVYINSFNMIYPPSYAGKITITADKNYLSTCVKGKFCFKFN